MEYLYTSAQDKNGWNVALEPHVLDNQLIKFDKVFKHFINKIDSIPTYNNFIDPVAPQKIDFENKKIIWN